MLKRWIPVLAVLAIIGTAIPTTSQADTLWSKNSVARVLNDATHLVRQRGLDPGAGSSNTTVDLGTLGTAPSTTTTTTTPVTTTAEGMTQFPGYWTSSTWPDSSLGFGGLYLQAMAANEFSNFMLFTVEPVLQDPASNLDYLADATGTTYPGVVESGRRHHRLARNGQR